MIKRLSILLFAAALTLVPLLAGEGEGYHKCDKGTQECLDALASHLDGRGWAGVDADQSPRGPVISLVYEGTPAHRKGIRKGDVLIAVNGIEFSPENMEKLGALEAEMLPGKTFELTFDRDGKTRDVSVTLEAMPDYAIARAVGKHMLQHATVELAAK